MERLVGSRSRCVVSGGAAPLVALPSRRAVGPWTRRCLAATWRRVVIAMGCVGAMLVGTTCRIGRSVVAAMCRVVGPACIAAMLFVASRAEAHGLRTAYVEITEIAPGRAVVHLRVTALDPALALAAPSCVLGPRETGSLYDRTWLLDCHGTLAGHTLALGGLGPIVDDAVVSIAYTDGTLATELVRPEAPEVALRTEPPSPLSIARDFIAAGLEHIATGYDHLLFLLLLVVLLRDVRSILLAETAFTLSHSLAFSATALGWLHVSAAAAEACIALSLVLLAADIRPAPASRWRGALLALVWGFVHGLGFAGGLRDIGVPEHAIAPALVGFGAGIELGQIAFLAIVLVTTRVIAKLAALHRTWPLRLATAYAIGCVSAYWFLERAVACFD